MNDFNPPVEVTRAELEEILRVEMQKILRSNVTTMALKSPSEMKYSDVVVNVHLFERLGTAYEAAKALTGFKGEPRGFKITQSA